MTDLSMLAADLHHARTARPDLDERALLAEALARGIRIRSTPGEDRVSDDLPAAERVARLRTVLAATAGEVSVFRWDLITEHDRFERAEAEDRRTSGRLQELQAEIIPPLKALARELRAELRRLEADLRGRGVDPDSIAPSIDWDRTILVEDRGSPDFESNDSRRHAAIEFFRRVGGP